MDSHDGVHVPDELERAWQALTRAYEAARAGGYEPGSPAIQALETAEQHYQAARDRRESEYLQDLSENDDQADVVLDLRDDDPKLDLVEPTTPRHRRS